jgi:hypothetical protein
VLLQRGRVPPVADAVALKRLAVWEQLALRQRTSRHSAEQTKEELVRQVQQNTDWIRRLMSLMAERSADRHASRRENHRAVSDWTRRPSWRDAALFGALKLELEKAHARMDQVLAACGVRVRAGDDKLLMASSDCSGRWSHVRSDSSGSTIVCTSILPFGVDVVASAAWDVIACVRRSSRSGFRSVRVSAEVGAPVWDAQVTEATDDSCSMKLRVCSENQSVSYRSVVKRFSAGGDGCDVVGSCADDTSGNDSRVVMVSMQRC